MTIATKPFIDLWTGINRKHPDGLAPDVIPGCPKYGVGKEGDDRLYSRANRGRQAKGVVAAIKRARKWLALLGGETRDPEYQYCINDEGGKKVHLTVAEARRLVAAAGQDGPESLVAPRAGSSIGDRVPNPPDAATPLFADEQDNEPTKEHPMKPFWVLWNPESSRPPTVRFYQYDAAIKAAEQMASRHPGQTFHVLEGKGSVAAAEVCWTFVTDEELPF